MGRETKIGVSKTKQSRALSNTITHTTKTGVNENERWRGTVNKLEQKRDEAMGVAGRYVSEQT